MKQPALVLPEALQALLALGKIVSLAHSGSTVPVSTLNLIYIRASQINGCGFCLDMHTRDAKKSGESDERLFAVGAWRETPFFSEAERAALDLTESVTRLADRPDPVSDVVWNEAARHYDEPGLASLVLAISLINVWNRLNVTTRQLAAANDRQK